MHSESNNAKIGILTFHRACNYGTVLQTYALQEVLGKFGVDCQIIDYRSEVIERQYKPFYFPTNLSLWKRLIRAFFYFPTRRQKRNKFSGFREEHLSLTQKTDKRNFETVTSSFDVVITGSDQVWNDAISNSDLAYFLVGVSDKVKKYSYAASFGIAENATAAVQNKKLYLEEFETISLREQNAVSVLNGHFTNVRFDIDPTLLLDLSEWQSLAQKPVIPQPYILIYTAQLPNELLEYARRLHAKTGLQLIYLNDSYVNNRDIKHLRGRSVYEFLGLIENAEIVLTTSFHGTIFSLIFQKNFYVEISGKEVLNERVENLLQKVNLLSRIISDSSIEEPYAQIDWLEVSSRLESYRQDSLAFLQSIARRRQW